MLAGRQESQRVTVVGGVRANMRMSKVARWRVSASEDWERRPGGFSKDSLSEMVSEESVGVCQSWKGRGNPGRSPACAKAQWVKGSRCEHARG